MLKGWQIHPAKLPVISGQADHRFLSPDLRRTFSQLTKFCVVGGSGVFVDMAVLYLLADPDRLGLNIALSKVLAAEVAMINNFVWNELWTFRQNCTLPALTSVGMESRSLTSILRRFLLFNAICGVGIGLAVLLLHLLHVLLGWNLYLSNLLAIVVVTFWNFGLNRTFNWRAQKL